MEFACRAGTKTRCGCGDNDEEIVKHANVADVKFREVTGNTWGIKGNDGYAFTSPVGLFQKNAFGLLDMPALHAMVFGHLCSLPAQRGHRSGRAGGKGQRVPRAPWRLLAQRPEIRSIGEPLQRRADDAGVTVGFQLAASVGKSTTSCWRTEKTRHVAIQVLVWW